MEISKVCQFRLHTFQSSVKSLFQTDLRRQLTKMGLPRMNHACLVNFLLQTIFALSCGGFPVEHKTCDILAAERLRLMRFDNRLIIDSFQEAVCLLKW